MSSTGDLVALYSAYTSHQATEAAKDQARESKKQMDYSKQRILNADASEAARTAQAAMLLSKRKAAAIGGKSSTLLTSPLGIPGSSNLTPKTALGA